MKVPRTSKGFTLIELLVVIGIIALLASIAMPAFTGVQVRAAQTKALANAKQIGLACATYAVDNNGQFPSYILSNGTATAAQVGDSNTAFDQLFPSYLSTISIFFQAGDNTFSPGAQPRPDPQISLMSATNPPLPQGTNHWAYVTGQNNTSNAAFPLIADAFASVAGHTYSTNQTAEGGIWKGQKAIVVFCDDHAQVENVNASLMVPRTQPNGNDDLFQSDGSGVWMTSGATGNNVVNPLGGS
jgi:prepilin-type N-terminal cleavage/methylation domain-containing protein